MDSSYENISKLNDNTNIKKYIFRNTFVFYGFVVSSIFSDKKLSLNIKVINTLYYDYLKKNVHVNIALKIKSSTFKITSSKTILPCLYSGRVFTFMDLLCLHN